MNTPVEIIRNIELKVEPQNPISDIAIVATETYNTTADLINIDGAPKDRDLAGKMRETVILGLNEIINLVNTKENFRGDLGTALIEIKADAREALNRYILGDTLYGVQILYKIAKLSTGWGVCKECENHTSNHSGVCSDCGGEEEMENTPVAGSLGVAGSTFVNISVPHEVMETLEHTGFTPKAVCLYHKGGEMPAVITIENNEENVSLLQKNNAVSLRMAISLGNLSSKARTIQLKPKAVKKKQEDSKHEECFYCGKTYPNNELRLDIDGRTKCVPCRRGY